MGAGDLPRPASPAPAPLSRRVRFFRWNRRRHSAPAFDTLLGIGTRLAPGHSTRLHRSSASEYSPPSRPAPSRGARSWPAARSKLPQHRQGSTPGRADRAVPSASARLSLAALCLTTQISTRRQQRGRSLRGESHRKSCSPSIPCDDAPRCPAAHIGGWVHRANRRLRTVPRVGGVPYVSPWKHETPPGSPRFPSGRRRSDGRSQRLLSVSPRSGGLSSGASTRCGRRACYLPLASPRPSSPPHRIGSGRGPYLCRMMDSFDPPSPAASVALARQRPGGGENAVHNNTLPVEELCGVGRR